MSVHTVTFQNRVCYGLCGALRLHLGRTVRVPHDGHMVDQSTIFPLHHRRHPVFCFRCDTLKFMRDIGKNSGSINLQLTRQSKPCLIWPELGFKYASRKKMDVYHNYSCHCAFVIFITFYCFLSKTFLCSGYLLVNVIKGVLVM
jgi:hypothetical protein